MINWIKSLFGIKTTEAEKSIIEDAYKVEPKVIKILNMAVPKPLKTIKSGTAKAPKAEVVGVVDVVAPKVVTKTPKTREVNFKTPNIVSAVPATEKAEKAEKVPKAAKAVKAVKVVKSDTVKVAKSPKAWYNDGSNQKLVPESEVPKGWKKGKLPKVVK